MSPNKGSLFLYLIRVITIPYYEPVRLTSERAERISGYYGEDF